MSSFPRNIFLYLVAAAAAAAKSLQSCLTLCDPIDGSPVGSSVPGILQARTLEWVAIFPLHRMKVKSESEVAQSSPTLSDPMDCSPPGSSVHGIFQARVLEWVAIASTHFPCSLQNWSNCRTVLYLRDLVRVSIRVWPPLGLCNPRCNESRD